MKKVTKILRIAFFAELILVFICSVSCKKQSNFIYKYSYTTESSLKTNRTSTSLSNYDELLTLSQIEAERLILRESKKNILNESVIKDTLILTNY
jgi:hypothetical protein